MENRLSQRDLERVGEWIEQIEGCATVEEVYHIPSLLEELKKSIYVVLSYSTAIDAVYYDVKKYIINKEKSCLRHLYESIGELSPQKVTSTAAEVNILKTIIGKIDALEEKVKQQRLRANEEALREYIRSRKDNQSL